MVEPAGIGVGVSRVAGRELTMAAQATGVADLINLLPEAARVAASWFPKGLEVFLIGLTGIGGIFPLGLPGFCRMSDLPQGLLADRLLLQLYNCDP